MNRTDSSHQAYFLTPPFSWCDCLLTRMGSTEDCTTVHGFGTFEVPGLASDQASTPTSMREDLLLSSWLIVLLGTREDGQATFDWAYDGDNGIQKGEVHECANRKLSTGQVMPSLQVKTRDVATAISRQIATQASSLLGGPSSPSSLVLSTGSLSRISEEAKDEVSRQALKLLGAILGG